MSSAGSSFSVSRLLVVCSMFVMFSPVLHAQEAVEGGGLEIDDPTRLGVSVVPGRGFDPDFLEEIVDEEFAQAGIEMIEPGDPRKHDLLVIWMGEAQSEHEDLDGWTSFGLSDFRMEFWRPVRYERGETEYSAAGITWVSRGGAGGGYAQGHDFTEAVCIVVSENIRRFLTEFLRANRKSYAPSEGQPSACGGS